MEYLPFPKKFSKIHWSFYEENFLNSTKIYIIRRNTYIIWDFYIYYKFILLDMIFQRSYVVDTIIELLNYLLVIS